jgi:hypothetical protein
MKQIIFPGNHRQPCEAQYGIFFDKSDAFFLKAHIVVVQTFGGNSGTSLINTDEGRNAILNHILSNDLYGVRTDYIVFSLIYLAGDTRHGFQFPIHFNMEDYVKRGNPHDVENLPPEDFHSVLLSLIGKGDKRYTVNSCDVVGGCARFFLLFDEREHLSGSEVDRLLAAVNYQPAAC